MSEPKKKARGRPFRPRGDKWSDKARGEASASITGPRIDPELNFAEFSRDLLASPQVRRAFTRRWKLGEISAAELRMVTESAAQAPPRQTDQAAAYQEEVRQLRLLTKDERMQLYRLRKKMMGEDLTKRAKTRPAPALPEKAEPDLDPRNPLGAARKRLGDIMRDRPEELRVEPPVVESAVPDQSMAGVVAVHAPDDERHRSVCVECRRAHARSGRNRAE